MKNRLIHRSSLFCATLALGAGAIALRMSVPSIAPRGEATGEKPERDLQQPSPAELHQHGMRQSQVRQPQQDGMQDLTLFDFSDESSGAEKLFTAVNTGYGLKVSCDLNGITLRPTYPANRDEAKWTFSMTNPAQSGSPSLTSATTVSYESKPGHSEWFINSSIGIEHGMNLASAPSSTEEPLQFNFKVNSDLRCEGGGENNLIFKDRQGIPALRYEKLIAYDANGKIIPTALTFDAANSSIAWQVDHQGFDYPIVIDPIIATFAQTLLPPSLAIGSFGEAVAMRGDFMAVGTPSGNRVYLYEKIAGTWTLFSRKNSLISPATNSGAFGTQVEMPDLDTIIVSDTSFDAPASTGGINTNQGAIFVFGRNVGGDNNWGLVRQFTVTDPQILNGRLTDRLGSVMSYSQNRIAAVAIRDGDSYDTALKFYFIFEKDRGGINNWGQIPDVKIETSNFSSSSSYGRSAGLSGDFLVVGSPAESFQPSPGIPAIQFQGAVYVYGRNQGGANRWGLLPDGRIFAPGGVSGDFFGRSVSISGGLIAVGADGRDLSPAQNGAGMVYILSRNEGGLDAWGVLPTRISAPDAAAGDSLGGSLQINGDLLAVRAGGDDVAGQANVGSVYLFEKNRAGSNAWGAIPNGKFSVDNVANIVKVSPTVFLSQGYLAFATNPGSGNSSLSIVNLSGSVSGDEGLGNLTFARDGLATFIPRAAGTFQLRTSTNLTTWANQGAAQAGAANANLIFNTGTPGAEPRRFYRIEK